MKNVIVVTDLNIAVPRMPQILKRLRPYGWNPIVITPYTYQGSVTDFEIVKSDYKYNLILLRKILGLKPEDNLNRTILKERINLTSDNFLLNKLISGFGSIFNYPDSEKGWISFAIATARKIFREKEINAMISCSSPVSSHIIANALKREFNIPWIADLRDLWSQNHNYPYGPLRYRIDRRLELNTLKSADLLTTVSSPWAKKLKELHQRDTVHVITNGFDPDILKINNFKLSEKFLISYTGTIYEGKQDPSKFFLALQNLLAEKIINRNDVNVRFYGPNYEWIDQEIRKFGLDDIVKQYNWTSQDIVIEKHKESQILLLFNWEDPLENGWSPLKIFGYMAAQRPILAIGGHRSDVIEHLIKDTNSGYYVSTSDEAKECLNTLYSQFKLYGKTKYDGKLEAIRKYSYDEKAREFANLLRNL